MPKKKNSLELTLLFLGFKNAITNPPTDITFIRIVDKDDYYLERGNNLFLVRLNKKVTSLLCINSLKTGKKSLKNFYISDSNIGNIMELMAQWEEKHDTTP